MREILFRGEQVAFVDTASYPVPPNTVYRFKNLKALEMVLRAPDYEHAQITDIGEHIGDKSDGQSDSVSIAELKKQLDESMSIHTSNQGFLNVANNFMYQTTPKKNK